MHKLIFDGEKFIGLGKEGLIILRDLVFALNQICETVNH